MDVARSEAVQPSLWDRLQDDLPGLVSEIASLRESLRDELGDDYDLDALVEGGLSELRRDTDLKEDAYRLAHNFILKSQACGRLQNRGVVVTADVLREAVRRDIEMLFNVERLEANYFLTDREMQRHEDPADMLADFPEVRRSVVNFGVPTFSGRKGSDFDRDELAASLKEVLETFEPRLKPGSIKVKVNFAEKVGLRVDLDAVLMLSPVPERLRLSTTIDLESGRASTMHQET
ncbi:GPW/gp25 family protein [Rhodobacteraceae bacterium]|nr:GPW/gp25 family protein [Paracoccaceae bacterium]